MVSFVDNQECLDLICKPPFGIVHILGDESNFPQVCRIFDATVKTPIKEPQVLRTLIVEILTVCIGTQLIIKNVSGSF